MLNWIFTSLAGTMLGVPKDSQIFAEFVEKSVGFCPLQSPVGLCGEDAVLLTD